MIRTLKTIRNYACFLLLLASSATAFAQGAATPAAQPASKWEKELASFLAQDKTNPPPKGAIVFTGSSSIRLWTNLPSAFPKLQTINRGFGGSQFSDVLEHLDLLVLKHQPRKIVLYSGDNDIAAGKAPAAVLADCEKILKTVEAKLPQTKVYFIATKPSPSRWQLRDKVTEFNKSLEALCAKSSNGRFIDVYTPMLDASGKPDPSLFVNDNLHLNGKGYELWARIVGPRLVEEAPGTR